MLSQAQLEATEGTVGTGSKAVFKTIASSKSGSKGDASHSREKAKQATPNLRSDVMLKPGEKLQLTVDMTDPRAAKARLSQVPRHGTK